MGEVEQKWKLEKKRQYEISDREDLVYQCFEWLAMGSNHCGTFISTEE